MAQPDENPNIIIQTFGNTAEMATDYGNAGNSFGAAHIPVSKMVWGDNVTGNRVTLTNPLPIQIAGQTGPTEISGSISGTTGGKVAMVNFVQSDLSYAPFKDGATGLHYLAVAGSTNGATPVGVTGQVQGIYNGIPVAVTGDVRILGAMGSDRNPSLGENYNYVVVAGSSAGETGYGGGGEVYPAAGYGVPIATTGGRRLSSATDSVNVVGTVNATGGRQLKPTSDAVVVYGTDQTKYIPSILYRSRDGATAGFSGDALKVAITNATGITFSVELQSTTTVNNSDQPQPLRVQGATGSSPADPVIVAGQNSGALEVVSTSGLSTTVSNTVNINDASIVSSLESSSKPIVNNLSAIKTGTNVISGIRSDLNSGNIKAQISQIVKPTSLRSGTKKVTNNSSQVHNNLEISSGITVKNHPSSQSNVLIGNSSLVNSADNGYLLEPGESIFLEINNLNKVYVRLESQGGQATVNYIGS